MAKKKPHTIQSCLSELAMAYIKQVIDDNYDLTVSQAVNKTIEDAAMEEGFQADNSRQQSTEEGA